MIEEIYHEVILAGWVTALILGICLLCCRVPDRPVFKIYIRSRRILAAAYIIFGLCIAQFSIFNLRVTSPYVAVALPLSYYYIEGILFGMSFSSLLDKSYISRHQLKRDFIPYIIFLIIAWSGALAFQGTLRTVMLIVASVWFFAAASTIAIRFLKIYHAAVNKLNDYYADNIDAFVKWLHKSTYGIIFFGLCGSILSFAPQWSNTVFMSCGIIMFIYIFTSLQNYILNYEEIEAIVADCTEKQCDTYKEDVNYTFHQAVAKWVEEGNYRKPGVTLQDLATAAATNRSYISAFINSEYKCNFREWINTMRMEYAKRLLTENQGMTIEKIATESGFSTSAYFCRQFQQREGITPSSWRDHLSQP